jgi:threonine/homoserine efflux transporter RhtA
VVEALGHFPPWVLATMDAAWLGLLFLPVGFSLRRDRRVLAAAGAAVAGLWFVPRIFELESTRITDLLGVAVALIVAASLSYYLRREPGEGSSQERVWEEGERWRQAEVTRS